MKGLNLPNLDPFKWDKPTKVETKSSSAVKVLINNKNTRIIGLKSMEIREVK